MVRLVHGSELVSAAPNLNYLQCHTTALWISHLCKQSAFDWRAGSSLFLQQSLQFWLRVHTFELILAANSKGSGTTTVKQVLNMAIWLWLTEIHVHHSPTIKVPIESSFCKISCRPTEHHQKDWTSRKFITVRQALWQAVRKSLVWTEGLLK